MASEEVAAADAALTALREAQAEVRRLTNERDVLLIERDQALAIGRTLLARVETAEKERDYWRVQAQDVLAELHEQAIELDAALSVVEAVRAYVQRETSCLPIYKADNIALGRIIGALRAYDEARRE